MSDLSDVVPLMTRMYPNGSADVNAFERAGGMPFLIRELLDAGLLHEDVNTVLGHGLRQWCQSPALDNEGELTWVPVVAESGDLSVLAPAHAPFLREGGMKLVSGNLGRAIMKVSAVPDDRWVIEAPARVFTDQQQVLTAYQSGELNKDVVVVVKGQGPKANGMPELHQLTPALTNLQEQGFKVALLTDGRLSGASGKVPAAIHLSPEALDDGPIHAIEDGDVIRIDGHHGSVEILSSEFEERLKQEREPLNTAANASGVGRELFAGFRKLAGPADEGAISLGWE
jgi:phosphogluconate dehydratase